MFPIHYAMLNFMRLWRRVAVVSKLVLYLIETPIYAIQQFSGKNPKSIFGYKNGGFGVKQGSDVQYSYIFVTPKRHVLCDRVVKTVRESVSCVSERVTAIPLNGALLHIDISENEQSNTQIGKRL